ncbi:tetratricopeptide repeat protein, partial [Streptosporangium sp. NPDC051023]|uniref:tetratricopeptide repeat protein n=1 Tax=Streptosporangium sp. NPDC051023 TaxID=3155410 RepID=UPI00344E7FDA
MVLNQTGDRNKGTLSVRDLQPFNGRWRGISLWVRRHLLVWIITATAVNAALIAVTTMLMQLPGQSDSVITLAILMVLTCSALAIALPIIGHRVEDAHRRAEERLQRDQRVAALLAHGHPSRLLLEQVNPERLGATPTRYTRSGNAPYVSRTPDDEQIRTALTAPGPPFPFVLVWGPTKAGKSRTLAEALHAALPARTQVLLPADGQALAELTRLGLPFSSDGPALVYLDDLTVADLEALTAAVLDTIAERAVFAATMTATRRSQILASGGDITHTARAALARTHNNGEGHELAFRALTPEEHAQATALYPGEAFRGSIAETLVGGTELIAKYRAGQDVSPAGYAIVQAAIDARRAGLPRPLTDAELTRLFAVYLPRVRAGMPATTSAYRNGLYQWAAVPIASQVALLTPAPESASRTDTPAPHPGWEVLDHLLSADEGALADCPARPIPEELWAELIDVATPADAHAITYAAYERKQLSHAITAARKAITSSDPDEAPKAAVNLGVLLGEQGEVEGARAAYQLAIDSGHPDEAPKAAVNLGVLLGEQGEVEGARAAYQLAIDSGHDQAPTAAGNLGILLKQQGEVEGARAAYQLAIDSGHPDQAPKAAFNLGVLLGEQGDPEGARAAYQLAIDSGHPDQAPTAAVNLGVLLGEQGDPEGARAAYQLAIDSGHPDQAPRAAFNLGILLKQQGEVEGARAAYQLAIDSGHDQAPTAAFNLGVLLGEQGDPEGARAAYQLAIDSGHPDEAPKAAVNLGVLLGEQGEVEGARAAYQLAIDFGHDQAPTAAINLGVLLGEQGEVEGARAA